MAAKHSIAGSGDTQERWKTIPGWDGCFEKNKKGGIRLAPQCNGPLVGIVINKTEVVQLLIVPPERGNSGERWKAIPGYEGLYAISTFGRVRSVDQSLQSVEPHTGRVIVREGRRGRMKKVSTGGEYPMVSLTKNKSGKFLTVHRLVCLAFYGPYPAGHVTNHINGNKHDNRLENLEVITSSENAKHAYASGLATGTTWQDRRIPKLTKDEIAEVMTTCKPGDRSGSGIKGLAEKFGVPRHTIRRLFLKHQKEC